MLDYEKSDSIPDWVCVALAITVTVIFSGILAFILYIFEVI